MRKSKNSAESGKCRLSRLPYPSRASRFLITNAINFCPSISTSNTGKTFKSTEFLDKRIPDSNKNLALAALGECRTNIFLSISKVRNEGKYAKCIKNYTANNTSNSGIISSYFLIHQQFISLAAHFKNRIFNISEFSFWQSEYTRYIKHIVSLISVYRRKLIPSKNKKNLLIEDLRKLTAGNSVIEQLTKMSSQPLIDKSVCTAELHGEIFNTFSQTSFRKGTWRSMRNCSSISDESINNNFNKLKIS